MKKLTNLERNLYKDILMTIVMVLISIPIWLNLDMSAYAMEANNYANIDYVQYEVLNKAEATLQTFYDEEALALCETNDILVYNNSNTVDNYSLVLKISKDNNIDLESVRINVNYDITYLNDYHFFEDERYYYYVLDSADIIGSSQKYIISMWNEKATENKAFNYDFVIV